MEICSNACYDNRVETYNSLLRVQTPVPSRSPGESNFSKVAGCCGTPFKLLEGLALIGCGTALWPIPCTVCEIHTRHLGNDVTLESCHLGSRSPNVPCHYTDTKHCYDQGVTSYQKSEGNKRGCNPSTETGPTGPGPRAPVHVSSTLTGYNLISTGVGKIYRALANMACCPIYTACWVRAECDEC